MNENNASQERAAPRRNFFLTTIVTSESREGVEARVRNLSAGGMMIEFADAPALDWDIGTRLSAELRNIGAVSGEVAWARGKRIGVKFDREIDPELARKPLAAGEGTPDFVKPVLVASRSLKYVEGLGSR